MFASRGPRSGSHSSGGLGTPSALISFIYKLIGLPLRAVTSSLPAPSSIATVADDLIATAAAAILCAGAQTYRFPSDASAGWYASIMMVVSLGVSIAIQPLFNPAIVASLLSTAAPIGGRCGA